MTTETHEFVPNHETPDWVWYASVLSAAVLGWLAYGQLIPSPSGSPPCSPLPATATPARLSRSSPMMYQRCCCF